MGVIDKSAVILEGVRMSGDISIGEDSSVWFNAVLRASGGTSINIGKRSNVQDNCTFHSSNGKNITVGDNVTIGHGAIIHCCTIEDNCIIGMGSIIMNKAVIGKNSIVGAGALVTENKVFPEGSLIVGVPAKAVRTLKEEEIRKLISSADEYVEEARKISGR